MFDRFKNLFGSTTVGDKSSQNPALTKAIEQSSVVYSRIPLHRFIGESRRNELSRQLFLNLNEIFKQRDPVAVCREQFVSSVQVLARYQVLVIPSPPASDPFGLRDQPGISGELRPHLGKLFHQIDDLRSALFTHAGSDEAPDHWDFVQRQFWEAHWHMETLNAARIALNDAVSGIDWKHAFLHAVSVSCEHLYRWELQLPPAFEESIAREAATAYSVFTDIVVSGAQDPVREWRDYYNGSDVPMADFSP